MSKITTIVNNIISKVNEHTTDVLALETLNSNHINLSGVTAYHLLQGNLSVDNTVLTNGFGLYLYTGNTTTLPTINLGMDITSQWGNTADESYGYLIKIKSRSATGDWTWVNSVGGITKYISSNTTAAEGTDANMFTLSTVAGVTTLNIGTSTRTNTNGVTYEIEVYQTTHRKTGVTNQGKSFTEHYNPDTGFTIEGYEGSGLAGHEIPHSLGRKLGFRVIKALTQSDEPWVVKYSSMPSEDSYLRFNETSAIQTSSSIITVDYENYINLKSATTTLDATNLLSNSYILYGWRNSYFDESGKLIGNFEIGVYQGTGVAGNKVTTRGKLALLMPKRLDTTGSWYSSDNQRNNGDSLLVLNTNQVEIIGTDHFDYISDGIICKSAATELNASGGQYLYFGVYDNDNGSGKSKYYKATDTANVQINNGIIPLAHGIDSNGSKNSIVVANETITGVTYTEGKNYLYKTDTGYGVKAYEPRYLASELVRRFAGEQPDYYDVESNKWFNCDAGAELVTNGTFSSGVTTGWISDAGASISISSNTLLVTATLSSSGYVSQSIATIIGKKYRLKCFINNTNMVNYGLLINDSIGTIFAETLSGAGNKQYDITFVAQSTTTNIKFFRNSNTAGQTLAIDNISVFPVDIVPTTEITESRNYLNHIVHADADGGVLYVEELPKVKYENLVVQGENRKVINLGIIYNNNRYVVENPFGNDKYMDCDVRSEVFINGEWGETGYNSDNTTSSLYGTKATSLSAGIVVQTGSTGVSYSLNVYTGAGFQNPATKTSAPARVIVTYVGVAK